MKIASINAYLSDLATSPGAVRVSAEIEFPAGTSLGDAIASVMGRLDTDTGLASGTVQAPMNRAPSPEEVQASEPAPSGRRRRGTPEAETPAAAPQEPTPAGRRRRGSDPAEVPQTPSEPTPAPTEPTPAGRRRRMEQAEAPTAPPTAAPPPDISDADLSRAASHTAAVLTELGDDGAGIIKAILKEDFAVTELGQIESQAARKDFLASLAEEIELAKKEAEAKTST